MSRGPYGTHVTHVGHETTWYSQVNIVWVDQKQLHSGPRGMAAFLGPFAMMWFGGSPFDVLPSPP
jgi:hypothetical protein